MTKDRLAHYQTTFQKLYRLGTRCIFLLIFGSCISVNLNSTTVEKAKAIEFHPPSLPFEEISTPLSDKAFQSKVTGSTIAFLSACGPKADIPLSLVSQDVISSFDRVIEQQSAPVLIDGREGLELTVTGVIDGVQTQIRASTFKKNGCVYSISYVALPESFEKELPFFQQFIEHFRAP